MADPTPLTEAPETTMSKVSETRRMYFAVTIWLTFVGFITFVSIHPVQLPGDTLGIIIGGMLTLAGGVVNYYFSTSMGSTIKGAINKVIPTPTITPTSTPPDGATVTETKP